MVGAVTTVLFYAVNSALVVHITCQRVHS